MQSKTDKIKRPIACAVVGLGRSGVGIHIELLRNNKMFSIVAVSDVNIEQLAKVSEDLGCKAYPHYNDVLRDPSIDLVIIATPSKLHHSMASDALLSEKNVILEKPIASNIEEANQLKKLSKKTGKAIVPFFNFRFVPEFGIIASALKENLIGKVYLIKRNVGYFNRRADWQSLIREGGGILNVAAIHHVDQVLQLVGKRPLEIWSTANRIVSKGDADDQCKIILSFGRGLSADIEVSWANALPCCPWEIYGSKGAIRQVGRKLEIKWFKESEVRSVKRDYLSYLSDEQINWNTKEYILPENYQLGITPQFYSKLHLFLMGNGKIPVNIDSAISTMEVITKISE